MRVCSIIWRHTKEIIAGLLVWLEARGDVGSGGKRWGRRLEPGEGRGEGSTGRFGLVDQEMDDGTWRHGAERIEGGGKVPMFSHDVEGKKTTFSNR